MSGLEAHLVVTREDGFDLDVAIQIEAGETVVLLGPNGAGKSTVVAALSGGLPIQRGAVRLNGHVFDDPDGGVFVPPADRRIGVVTQLPGLFPHMSVRQNVAFGPRSDGAPRREADAVAMSWLDRLGVAELADRRPTDISGGQAQRVALARALATDPAMLVLDEPLSALDVTTRADTRRLLQEHLAGVPGPRLVVTHDPTEAFLLADRIVVVEAGRITQDGTVEVIRRHPMTPYAADMVGVNLLRGVARGGVVEVKGSAGQTVTVPSGTPDGPTLVTIHPRAVALHLDRPEGSPRNVWRTTVARVESVGDRVRVGLGAPLDVTAEVTPTTISELGLVPGREVWASLKATQIRTSIDQPRPDPPKPEET